MTKHLQFHHPQERRSISIRNHKKKRREIFRSKSNIASLFVSCILLFLPSTEVESLQQQPSSRWSLSCTTSRSCRRSTSIGHGVDYWFRRKGEQHRQQHPLTRRKVSLLGDSGGGRQQQEKQQQQGRRIWSLLFESTNRRRKKNRRRYTQQFQAKLEELQQENDYLRDTVRQLQVENEQLHRQQMIVLETFEGEGKLINAANEQQPLATAVKALALAPTTSTTAAASTTATTASIGAVADWGVDMDMIDGDQESTCCPIEPTISFGEALRDRAYWLVGLLIMQSASGVILSRNEALLANHPVIVYFLTMLVGAGGNAGNQASVRVIRGLALGTLNEQTQSQFLSREFKMAVALSSVLSMAGFLRAAAFRTPFPETVAVTTALALIVFSSICLGAVLPLLLKKIGVDPAHSSTTIQVVMDILGVILAVAVSSLLLDSPLGGLIITRLTGG